MFEVKRRDAKVKTRKFRNVGEATGTLKRLNGEIIPIALCSKDFDKLLNNTNNCRYMILNFEGEEVNTWIKETVKHLTLHNTINVDFLEVNRE